MTEMNKEVWCRRRVLPVWWGVNKGASAVWLTPVRGVWRQFRSLSHHYSTWIWTHDNEREVNLLSWRENGGNGECGKLGKHCSRHFDIFVWCNVVRQALAVVTNHPHGKLLRFRSVRMAEFESQVGRRLLKWRLICQNLDRRRRKCQVVGCSRRER